MSQNCKVFDVLTKVGKDLINAKKHIPQQFQMLIDARKRQSLKSIAKICKVLKESNDWNEKLDRC